jgi:hypothetical protein
MADTIGRFKISLSTVIPTVLDAGFYYKKFGDIQDRGVISAVLTAANIKIAGTVQVVPIHVMKAYKGNGDIAPRIQ